jgi:hypothetical protein
MIRSVKILLLLCLMILAGATLVYSIIKTNDKSGSIDFHSYWYSGHFVRLGIDPYHAYLTDMSIGVPIKYLDQSEPKEPPIAQPGLARVPANTAPMVLILSILSFFSWPTAKTLWMLCNLITMLAVPLLIFRILPDDREFTNYSKLMIYLAFIGLFGTRNTIGNGQTSLLVFAFMLISLITVRRSWLWSGIWLGLALSKYSLSMPIFIYFIIRKKYRVLVTSVVFQLLGTALLSWLTNSSLKAFFNEYIAIFRLHTNLPGIQIATLFQNPIVGAIAAAILTTGTFGAIYFWWKRNAFMLAASNWYDHFIENHIISILILWTLLVAYHRAYDSFTTIIFIALVIYGLDRKAVWQLSTRQRYALAFGLILAYIPLSLPASGIIYLIGSIPDQSLSQWLGFQGGLLSITLLAMLGAVFWLLLRIKTRENVDSMTMSET